MKYNLTKQEAFDRVIAQMIKQGGRSVVTLEGEVLPAYRGRKGAMCAIGCLIPDEVYSKQEIEFNGVGVIIQDPQSFPVFWEYFGEALTGKDDVQGKTWEKWRFFHELQGAHDFAHQKADFIWSMQKIAKEYDLDCRLLDGLTRWNRAVGV